VLRFEVGDVPVAAVAEIEWPIPAALFVPDMTPEAIAADAAWLVPRYVDPEGNIRIAIQALCVEADGRRIVVDTCMGNGKRRGGLLERFAGLQTDLLDRLTALGFGPGEVDTVVCTHLHVDHVGWNTRLEAGRWVPTFPRARYVVSARDLEHWSASADPMHAPAFADSVQPVVDAGLVDAVDPGHDISPSVSLIATPGHTPGHVSVRIASSGEVAYVTGDLVHTPAQLTHPEWSSVADGDPVLAQENRRSFGDRVIAEGALVIGTHFPAPTAGRLVRDPAVRWID
jgi:glyoxylase-like metal-dependent hydrolase (beta-lactamase superfamily II)